jgi:hypothetical protein
MKNLLIRSLIFFLVFGVLSVACKSSKTTASKYVGEWHYTIEWDGTEYPIRMIINTSEDGYTGIFS